MIYLVRHGQTDWNLLNKFNGYTETELNQTGIEQVKLQAEQLKEVNLDICFCSPQKRARQAGEILYKGEMMIDERLMEINCGEFEGTEETIENMKLFWQAVKHGDKGTETLKSFMKRNCEFCNMVMQKYRGKNVLIVTHAANARIINYYFTGQQKDYDFTKSVAKDGEILKFKN